MLRPLRTAGFLRLCTVSGAVGRFVSLDTVHDPFRRVHLIMSGRGRGEIGETT